jgi:hypothetical protein
MAARYDDVLGPLREAYDARAVWRDGLAREPWKLASTSGPTAGSSH